jgi:hypothetical protein
MRVEDSQVRKILMPDKVIRCRFDLNHEVFAGGFYDVRWFRAHDRGKLIEITRERFQLQESLHRPPDGICIAKQSEVGSQSASHQRGRDQAAEVGSRGGG